MLFVSNNRHDLNITETNSKLPLSKGQLKKYSSHDFYSITGGLAATAASFVCGAIIAVIIGLAAGGLGLIVGISLWKVGIAQASSTMVLVGKIFTYYGIGAAGLFGSVVLLITSVLALLLGGYTYTEIDDAK